MDIHELVSRLDLLYRDIALEKDRGVIDDAKVEESEVIASMILEDYFALSSRPDLEHTAKVFSFGENPDGGMAVYLEILSDIEGGATRVGPTCKYFYIDRQTGELQSASIIVVESAPYFKLLLKGFAEWLSEDDFIRIRNNFINIFESKAKIQKVWLSLFAGLAYFEDLAPYCEYAHEVWKYLFGLGWTSEPSKYSDLISTEFEDMGDLSALVAQMALSKEWFGISKTHDNILDNMPDYENAYDTLHHLKALAASKVSESRKARHIEDLYLRAEYEFGESMMSSNFSISKNFWGGIFSKTIPLHYNSELVKALRGNEFKNAGRIKYTGHEDLSIALLVADADSLKGFVCELAQIVTDEERKAMKENFNCWPNFDSAKLRRVFLHVTEVPYTWISLIAAIAYSDELIAMGDNANDIWQLLYSLNWVGSEVESYQDGVCTENLELAANEVVRLKALMNSIA